MPKKGTFPVVKKLLTLTHYRRELHHIQGDKGGKRKMVGRLAEQTTGPTRRERVQSC